MMFFDWQSLCTLTSAILDINRVLKNDCGNMNADRAMECAAESDNGSLFVVELLRKAGKRGQA